MSHVLVLCPMEIERAAVARAFVRASIPGVRVERTGVGKDAIIRTCERQLAKSRPSVIILAGVCGGLTHGPDLPDIARIVDEHGHSWSDFLGAEPAGTTLVAVDRIVATPAEKAALAQRTGASIVDMESHAFAEWCEKAQLRWGVVRGVSDTPDESLPHELLNWLRPDGTTSNGRAMFDMMRKPTLVPHIFKVVRRSNRVLPLVGARAVELVRLAMRGA
jgi:adenosylhomocysteine nucleosidase